MIDDPTRATGGTADARPSAEAAPPDADVEEAPTTATEGAAAEQSETAESAQPMDVCLEAQGGEEHRNTCNCTSVIVNRVELYYHNNTHPEWEPDVRDMFPFTTDEVRLQAIIWAKLDDPDEDCQEAADDSGEGAERPARGGAASDEFRPYASPSAVTPAFMANDGHFCCHLSQVEVQRPDFEWAPEGRRGRAIRLDFRYISDPPIRERWRDQRLDPELDILPWPPDWPAPVFHWEELRYTTISGTSVSSMDDRTYTYGDPVALTPDPEAEGWSLTMRHDNADRPLLAGTRRYRVWIDTGDRIRPRRRGATLTSCTENEMNAGEALHLLVREGRMPADGATEPPDDGTSELVPSPYRYGASNRTDDRTREYLRWMTAFLTAPYENGGHYVGGKLRTQAQVDATREAEAARAAAAGQTPQRLIGASAGGYGGYGLDCSGLPSIAGVMADMEWGQDRQRTWRRTNYGRLTDGRAVPDGNPIPADLLFDPWNNWTRQEPGRWTWQRGTPPASVTLPDDVDGTPLGELVRPGDLLSSGPGGRFSHARTIYEVIEVLGNDARIRIIEASSGAGEVRLAETTLRTALANQPTMYGLWRPRPAGQAAGQPPGEGAQTGTETAPPDDAAEPARPSEEAVPASPDPVTTTG